MVRCVPRCGQLLTRSIPFQILTSLTLSGPGFGLCPVWLRSWPSIGQAVSARQDGAPGVHAPASRTSSAISAAATRTILVTRSRRSFEHALVGGIDDLHGQEVRRAPRGAVPKRECPRPA